MSFGPLTGSVDFLGCAVRCGAANPIELKALLECSGGGPLRREDASRVHSLMHRVHSLMLRLRVKNKEQEFVN